MSNNYSKRVARAKAREIKSKHIDDNHNRMYYLLKGFLISILISVPLFFIISLAIHITDFPEELMPPALLSTILISIVAASFYSTLTAKSKGWFNGSLIGLLYALILVTIRWYLENNIYISKDIITTLLSGLLIGSICGIAGLNIGEKIRKTRRSNHT